MARVTDFDSSRNSNNPSLKIRRKVGEALSKVNDFTSNDTVSTILTSEANKLWRAKILLDRVTRPGPKDKPAKNIPNKNLVPRWGKHISEDPKANSNLYTFSGGSNSKFNRLEKEQMRGRSLIDVHFETNDGTEPRSYDRAFARADSRERNDIIIYNMTTAPIQYLVLQTVPQEIEFQGESVWAVINSIGRNTPMYHFTGAESMIHMNISWYCDDRSNPQEVVTKCRLLEAWSKANGYMAGPPVLKIQWGRSELFKDHLFILTAATYKLSNWKSDVKVWDRSSKKFVRPTGYADPALYPSMATQELVFRRVSATNLTYEDIVPSKWLENTSGFGKEKSSK